MKKIIYTLLVAVLALSFMGCPTVNSDLNPQLDLTGLFLKGEADGWGDGFPLVKQADGTWTANFVAPAAEMQFKVATADWATAYPLDKDGACGVIALGDEAEFFAGDSGFDNPKVTGLSSGNNYVMVVTPLSTSIMIKVIEGEASGPVSTAAEPDLSAINATTLAQPGAYILIKGDAWGDATVGKYSFNQKGDAYVAVIPFNIAADANNGWGTDHYQAWGMIGVGDNKDVKSGEKQFNFADGKLNFDATNNIDFADIVAGTKGVITVTATADGCTCVATVY